MENLTLGLGITSVSGLCVALAYWIVKKGMHSHCVVGKLDIDVNVNSAPSPSAHDSTDVAQVVQVQDSSKP